MRPSNPACYECPSHNYGMHHWLIRDNGTSYCLKCNLELNKENTDDIKDTRRRNDLG